MKTVLFDIETINYLFLYGLKKTMTTVRNRFINCHKNSSLLFQSGNELITERAYLTFVNSSILKDMKFVFGKFNRTHSGLNCSFEMLYDFEDKTKVCI